MQTLLQIATFLKDELLGFSDFFAWNFFVLLLPPFKHRLPPFSLKVCAFRWGLKKLRWWKLQGEVKETPKAPLGRTEKQHLAGQKHSQWNANCFGRLLDFFQSHTGQTWILLLLCNDTNLKYYISSDGLNKAFPQILSLYFPLKIQKLSSWS